MNRDTILQRSEQVTFQSVAGEAILVRIDGTYFSLNPVGTDFWELLDGRSSIAQHAATIAAKYNYKADELAAAIINLARQKANIKAQQALADQYDVELEFIQGHMGELTNAPANTDFDRYQQTIADEFHVTPEMVQDDLIEVAQEMYSDKLVTIH